METGIAFIAGWAVGVVWSRAWGHVFSGGEQRPARLTQLHSVAVAAAIAPEEHGDQWRLHVTQFAFAGNIYGFGQRRLAELGIVTRPAWTTYISLMRRAGVLQVEERASSVWASGWGYPRFKMELRYGPLSIPYPARRPPHVSLGGKPTQMTQANTAQRSDTA